MATKILSKNSIVPVAVAVIIAAFSIAHAASVFDITFPIPELGNCADRLACKAYCNDTGNRSACQSFAQSHGLNTGSQSQNQNQNDDKVQAIQQDGGPGQCAVGAADPQKACRAYCNDSAHIQECVAYGKAHGFLTGDHLAQAEKVAAALKSGVALPAGCTDQASCRETCQDPSSLDQAKSCFAFAKAAGLLPQGFNEAQAEKVFSAIAGGTAPFSSMKDMQQCDHPTDPAVIKKCTDFAVQTGMMTQQQADTVQQTGGKGPGGCTGKDACDAYCAAHQSECFQFAQQHDLVTPQQQDNMKRAAEEVQNALDNAPSGVKDCIVAAVGQDTLNAITAGAAPGTPAIGQAMRHCFNEGRQGGDQGSQQEGDQQFVPPSQGNPVGPAGPNAGGNFQDQNGSSNNSGGPGERFMPPPSRPNQRFMPPPHQGQGPSNGQGGPAQWKQQGQDQNGAQPNYPQNGMMQNAPGGANGPDTFMPPGQSGGGTGSFAPPIGTFNGDSSAPPPPSPSSPTSFIGLLQQAAAATFSVFIPR